MAEDSISRKFVPDYLTLRSSVKKNLKFGVWAFLKEKGNRTNDKIKAVLLDLFIVKTSKTPNKNTRIGRKNEKSELSDDRYLFANNIEKILTLCSFKSEDFAKTKELLNHIIEGKSATAITDLIEHGGSAVKEFYDDHSMSIVRSGNTNAIKYKINDVLDLSEDELLRLYNALFITSQLEPLNVPCWFILKKLRAAIGNKNLPDKEDIILQHDISDHIIEAPMIWTFLCAVLEDKGICMNYSKDKTEEFQALSAELIFNDMNGKIYLNTNSGEYEINTIIDIRSIDKSKVKSDNFGSVKEKKTNSILKFSDLGYSFDELKEMFGNDAVEQSEDGSITIKCKNYKDLKPFIRKNYEAFKPDNNIIKNELKADCLAALENYGGNI